MIVVDTSVWVDAMRRPAGETSVTLSRLIDAEVVTLAAPVRMELTAGVARQHRTAVARGLSALPLLVPTEETWSIAERWVVPAADRGERFGMADLLIAALAEEIGALVWSLDSDFVRLETLGYARLYDAI